MRVSRGRLHSCTLFLNVLLAGKYWGNKCKNTNPTGTARLLLPSELQGCPKLRAASWVKQDVQDSATSAWCSHPAVSPMLFVFSFLFQALPCPTPHTCLEDSSKDSWGRGHVFVPQYFSYLHPLISCLNICGAEIIMETPVNLFRKISPNLSNMLQHLNSASRIWCREELSCGTSIILSCPKIFLKTPWKLQWCSCVYLLGVRKKEELEISPFDNESTCVRGTWHDLQWPREANPQPWVMHKGWLQAQHKNNWWYFRFKNNGRWFPIPLSIGTMTFYCRCISCLMRLFCPAKTTFIYLINNEGRVMILCS